MRYLTTERSGVIILGYDDICSLRGAEVEPWKGGKGGGEAIKIKEKKAAVAFQEAHELRHGTMRVQ